MPIRKAVFPAAGLGTRFLPATKAQPKEMLPLVDTPIIQYAVEEAVGSGVTDVIIISGRGKRAIEDHFDRSLELEMVLDKKKDYELLDQVKRISDLATVYYIRQKEPLGLGHAVLIAKDLVGHEAFAVILSDDIIDSDIPCLQQMIEVYERYKCSVLAVERVPKSEISSYGVVEARQIDGRLHQVTALVEKPSAEEAPSDLGIVGRYILTPEIFEMLEEVEPDQRGEIQLTNGLRLLCEQQAIYAYEFEGRRYDAGSKLGFLKATVEYALKRPDLGPEFSAYLKALKCTR